MSFNPRSRTGNDYSCNRIWDTPAGFNPRSRTGNDGNVEAGELGGYIVSIHVPARGTTSLIINEIRSILEFQSTFPHGERRPKSSALPGIVQFQSTFPHGERLLCGRGQPAAICFNPRSRTGNDMSNSGRYISQSRFQSTFPHGERR